MAPSVSELAQPVVVAVENTAASLKQVNVADVRSETSFLSQRSPPYIQKGPSYPFYYPYFDVEEKFPPTEIFGKQ